jgi:hypothetical protein
MAKIASLLTLLVTVLLSALPATSAQAAARERVFVASYGIDSGTCTFGSPCKTFQYAVDNVAVGGEVTAIDSAGFGPIIISQSVTISSPAGVEASIAPTANGTSIEINAGSNGLVALRGLTLEGAATGRSGVIFNSGSGLEITNCVIRNFTDTGVFVDTSGGLTYTNLLIANSHISGNPTAGINIQPSGALINATMDHVTVFNNGYGIYLGGNPSGASVIAAISNSTVTQSYSAGITGVSLDGVGQTNVMIRDTEIFNGQNPQGGTGIGISVSGLNTVFTLSRVAAFFNDTGVSITSGIVKTANNNDLNENATPVSSALTPAAEQ